jgi:tetratricopeptide (TPR) repeat protein
MQRPVSPSSYHCLAILISVALSACPTLEARASSNSIPRQSGQSVQLQQSPDPLSSEAELRTGIEMTRRGLFSEAIPHFLAAEGHVSDEYAAKFNLALCYVGTAQFHQAIRILLMLRSSGHSDANVENLLAQAYIGGDQPEAAFQALQRAAAWAPKNEKLYLLAADACADRKDYGLGVRVVDLALRHLPNSARLHYHRGYFLSMLDQFDDAKPEFDLAAALAPHADIAFLAAAQKSFLAGNLAEAIRIGRAAAREGHDNYVLLTILSEALIRSGASPGQPDFKEAEVALTKAVAERPRYASSQIALGYLLLLDNRVDSAVEHLEKGLQLDPRNPSVYSHLAVAYRKLGKQQQSDAMLATLAQLNAEQAARINSALGERKAIPGSAAGNGRIWP